MGIVSVTHVGVTTDAMFVRRVAGLEQWRVGAANAG
jgi:hypothetical protein